MELQSKRVIIDGSETPYIIYSDGRIYSEHRKRFMSLNSVRRGYRFVILCDATTGLRKYKMIHRMVAEAFIPNPDNLPVVNHIDGNKLNNAVENLEWCTASENTQHAFRTGLMHGHLGEDNHFTKLDEATVIRICELLDTGYKSRDISDMLNVSLHQIANIRCGLAWTHISSKYKHIKKKTPKFKKFHKLVDSMILEGKMNGEIYETLIALSGLTEKEMYNLVNGRRLQLKRNGQIM